jgi:hypothetical protein
MTRRSVLVPLVAGTALVLGILVAIALPMYTCMDPYEFEEFPGPGGGPTCAVSDTGYTPQSWLPTKVTIGVGGLVAALAVVLWSLRRRIWAVALVGVYGVLAIAWFLFDA